MISGDVVESLVVEWSNWSVLGGGRCMCVKYNPADALTKPIELSILVSRFMVSI